MNSFFRRTLFAVLAPLAALIVVAAVAGLLFAFDRGSSAATSPTQALPDDPPLPRHLRDTGLFVDASLRQVRPGNVAFAPRYALWSDGATKRRWIHLPPGTAIDATLPDAWQFPRGVRLWKEFSHQGRPVETRYIERLHDGSWRYATYVWTEDGADAVLAPAAGIASLAVAQAPAGRYVVPSEEDCRACHEAAPVPVLGFSAIQLSLASPAASASPLERAATGYLHANCGHCHHRGESAVPVTLALAQSAAASADSQPAWRTAVGAPSRYRPPGAADTLRLIAPGRPAESVLSLRMHSRDPHRQMPPLGTRLVDDEGVALIDEWIESMIPAEEAGR